MDIHDQSMLNEIIGFIVSLKQGKGSHQLMILFKSEIKKTEPLLPF